jgi:hypothetical protein
MSIQNVVSPNPDVSDSVLIPLAACCIAISGHMGSRAVFKIEKFLEAKMGGTPPAEHGP